MRRTSRCGLISAVVLVVGCATLPVSADKQPGGERKTPAAATGAVIRLREATQQAWQRRRKQIPPQEAKEIETLGRTIRSNPGQLFVTFLSFGTIHHLWSPFVDIPVANASAPSPAGVAKAFLVEQRDLSGVNPDALMLVKPAEKSRSIRFLQRTGEGRPVFAAEAYVNVGATNGVHLVTANLLPEDARRRKNTRRRSRILPCCFFRPPVVE
jgi:hypothetical protein